MSIEEMLQCICSDEDSTQEADNQGTDAKEVTTQEVSEETYTDTTEDGQE